MAILALCLVLRRSTTATCAMLLAVAALDNGVGVLLSSERFCPGAVGCTLPRIADNAAPAAAGYAAVLFLGIACTVRCMQLERSDAEHIVLGLDFDDRALLGLHPVLWKLLSAAVVMAVVLYIDAVAMASQVH